MLRAKSYLKSQAERKSKLSTNRRRTAWFVGLTNAIQFPKYSMAPTAAKLQNKRSQATEAGSFMQTVGPTPEHLSAFGKARIDRNVLISSVAQKRHSARDEPIQTLGRFAPGRPSPGLRPVTGYRPQRSPARSVRHSIDPSQPIPDDTSPYRQYLSDAGTKDTGAAG